LLRKPQEMLGGYFILPHPVVSLYLKCTFKSDTKQIAEQTHRRINEFYRRLRYDMMCVFNVQKKAV